ncbi:MAG: DUF2269 family protein [Nitrospirota bacterium]
MEYLMLKTLHIVSAAFLFGTGLGSAFYKYRADRGGDLRAIVFASKNVVFADWIFTAPSVVIQPITGLLMAHWAPYALTQTWLMASIGLYVLAAGCWLPAVYLQIRMRDVAVQALERNMPLPPSYHRMARIWFWLGVPAFMAVIVIFHLMVFKP